MALKGTIQERRNQAVQRMRDRLADTPENLVDDAFDTYDQLGQLRAIYGVYEAKLLIDMEESKATMLVGESGIAKLQPGKPSYFWDAEPLQKVIDGALGEGAYTDYMKWVVPEPVLPYWKVDTVKTNALMNQMGEGFRAAAMECRRIERLGPRIEWQEK